jgi:hypothetical protein
MVLREDRDAVICIGQPAHAHVSGQLARSWGNERFGEVHPREEVRLGAEQHDVGMALWDTAPELNPDTGRPYSFMEMPLERHLELWGQAHERMRAQNRYAALLVSLHGAALYQRRDLDRADPDDAAAIRAFLDGQRAVQDELMRALRSDPQAAPYATPDLLARNQRLIWTWDFLSLALCLDWAPTGIDDVPTAGEPTRLELTPVGEALAVDPWPFGRDRVELRCEGRRLQGRFDDEEEMRAALYRAPWVTLRFELAA